MTSAYVFSSDPLAAWGQAAAIVLLIELFFFILIGLALAFGLAFGLTWIHEKAQLLKKLRPFVDSMNITSEASLQHEPPPTTAPSNKIVRSVAQVPGQLTKVDEKIQQGNDKVAHAVIEFHGRTEMAKTVLKNIFLPGLNKSTQKSKILEPSYENGTQEYVPTETMTPQNGEERRNNGLETLRNVTAR